MVWSIKARVIPCQLNNFGNEIYVATIPSYLAFNFGVEADLPIICWASNQQQDATSEDSVDFMETCRIPGIDFTEQLIQTTGSYCTPSFTFYCVSFPSVLLDVSYLSKIKLTFLGTFFCDQLESRWAKRGGKGFCKSARSKLDIRICTHRYHIHTRHVWFRLCSPLSHLPDQNNMKLVKQNTFISSVQNAWTQRRSTLQSKVIEY